MQNLAPTDSDYELIAKLVYKHSRIHLGDGKRELVSSRLGKRLRALVDQPGGMTREELQAMLDANAAQLREEMRRSSAPRPASFSSRRS